MGKKIVAVALSGGVDSAVSALLLKQAGYEVFALFMKNWDEKECPAETDYQDIIAICHQLDIPYYTVNFTEAYYNQVFTSFVEDLKKGFTPNPDILCNREIKFDALFKKALELGADYLATGHYAQTDHTHLLKGLDPNKDQSYFLYTIKSSILEKTLFPIGHLLKPEVRKLAEMHRIPVFNKKDSTGICFIGNRNFREFMMNYISTEKGPILDVDGKVLGEHVGISFYTIGQRKGLGIGGPGDAYFVVDKDPQNNTVIVAQGIDHPALYRKELIAELPSWIASPPPFPKPCFAKIRYRQVEQPCTIYPLENSIHVVFDKPQRAVTPYQSIVFYDGEKTLGGSRIL
ncbi:MAG: tRNA 2-thiouridine(34) synthase MnmA [Simkaniaceae bacterium]|nr:tRNA 2-thiouridine(34) synthase MnmA [Simkaniaceae bacterium]